MKTISICSILAFAVATTLFGQLSPKYASWADGPVRHIMTKDEIRQWTAIKNDKEAGDFIDLFWAKRDPTPATPRNEFRDDFDQRVKFADANFGNGLVPGSMTD